MIRKHYRVKDGRRIQVPFFRAGRDAHLVSSELADGSGQHAPVIDIDVPCRLVPSATPGHSHLYIDVPMSGSKLWNLLYALSDAGILEEGYASACTDRGAAFVRTPWAPKGVGPALDGGYV